LAKGGFLLKRARDLCESLDELSDDEKRAEVLPIMVQQAYVLTKLGKLEEAEALQKMIQIAEYVILLVISSKILTNLVFLSPHLEWSLKTTSSLLPQSTTILT